MVDTYILSGGTLVPLYGVNPPTGGGGSGVGLFPGDPGTGLIMWGQTREGSIPAVAARAAQYYTINGGSGSGHTYPKCARIYIQPFATLAAGISAANSAVSDAATVQGWGSMPFVDCKELTGKTPAELAAGAMDSVIDALMEGLVATGKPCLVGYHQEPTGADAPGGVKFTGTSYAAVIQRFGQRRDAAGGKSLITLTGCLGIGSYRAAGGGINVAAATPWVEPLAPVCDVWGSHKYLQALDGDPASAWNIGMDKLFGQFWDLQDSFDNTKARVHGEWGVHTWSSNLAFAPQFMADFMTYGIAHRLRAACFFDSGLNSHGHPWDLDLNGETSRLNEMAHQLIDPRVAGPAPV